MSSGEWASERSDVESVLRTHGMPSLNELQAALEAGRNRPLETPRWGEPLPHSTGGGASEWPSASQDHGDIDVFLRTHDMPSLNDLQAAIESGRNPPLETPRCGGADSLLRARGDRTWEREYGLPDHGDIETALQTHSMPSLNDLQEAIEAGRNRPLVTPRHEGDGLGSPWAPTPRGAAGWGADGMASLVAACCACMRCQPPPSGAADVSTAGREALLPPVPPVLVYRDWLEDGSPRGLTHGAASKLDEADGVSMPPRQPPSQPPPQPPEQPPWPAAHETPLARSRKPQREPPAATSQPGRRRPSSPPWNERPEGFGAAVTRPASARSSHPFALRRLAPIPNDYVTTDVYDQWASGGALTERGQPRTLHLIDEGSPLPVPSSIAARRRIYDRVASAAAIADAPVDAHGELTPTVLATLQHAEALRVQGQSKPPLSTRKTSPERLVANVQWQKETRRAAGMALVLGMNEDSLLPPADALTSAHNDAAGSAAAGAAAGGGATGDVAASGGEYALSKDALKALRASRRERVRERSAGRPRERRSADPAVQPAAPEAAGSSRGGGTPQAEAACAREEPSGTGGAGGQASTALPPPAQLPRPMSAAATPAVTGPASKPRTPPPPSTARRRPPSTARV